MSNYEFCRRCYVLEDAIIQLIKQYDVKRLGAHSLIRRLKKLVKPR
jgi:hypothetical protein